MQVRRAITALAVTALGLAGTAAATAPASASTGTVDMQAACNDQYPDQGRLAKIRERNAYGWKCVSGAVPVSDGGINVTEQCRSQYAHPNATANYRNWNDPYSWYCTF